MSELTLNDLLATDAAPWHAAADRWRLLAKGLDQAADQLIRATRDLPHAWPHGSGSDAAAARATKLRAEVGNTHDPAKRIFEAMDQHAYGMNALRRQAEEIVAAARKAGCTVDTATTTVTGPESAHPDSLRADLRAVVHKARALDDSTAHVITANTPSPGAGSGHHRPHPISRTDLEAQARRTPAQVHRWWTALAPDQRKQAVRNHPGLVGALDGIPATDRDHGNRVVLRHAVTALEHHLAELTAREKLIRSMISLHRSSELYPESANPGRAAVAELDRIADERDTVEGTLTGARAIRCRLTDPDAPPALLLGFSTEGDGRAIVAVGNPDLAGDVVTYVPGAGDGLPGIAGELRRVDAMATGEPATATVLWLDSSTDPADELRSFQQGLRATHDGPPPHHTVIGHG
ncbi:hypothetical protein Acy02nite_16390 [Actinoplanes cyaneus]|uniref:Uncharacterized protein n=1 Tax=Actinoplanes cyaneus TaxID=52696 RepID=A0A919M426_9ACTN|nr:hypothetical protein [Actinoplanes cyaneus]MCW2142085.1 hypothetical protein [Actinoplanes cyaneus]GID63758.1 hypothetical protein Acy02nite_16390 [Actinoplanes cyaneus]